MSIGDPPLRIPTGAGTTGGTPDRRVPRDLPESVHVESTDRKIIRDKSTPEGKAFWQDAERIAAQTRDWPDSRKAGINVGPTSELDSCEECEPLMRLVSVGAIRGKPLCNYHFKEAIKAEGLTMDDVRSRLRYPVEQPAHDARQRLERQARKGDELDAAIARAEQALEQHEAAAGRAAMLLDELRVIRDAR